MSYRSLPIGNLSNTNITFGSGIQSDASFSYVSVNCDPKVVLPRTSVTDPINPTRNMPKRYQGDLDIAGKIAVERDICNLEVANLKVTGTLIIENDPVFKSCVTIALDGRDCCPLTVQNTDPTDAQSSNALCVIGPTNIEAPNAIASTSTTTGFPLLTVDARNLQQGTNAAAIVLQNLDSGDGLFIGGKGNKLNTSGASDFGNYLSVEGNGETGIDQAAPAVYPNSRKVSLALTQTDAASLADNISRRDGNNTGAIWWAGGAGPEEPTRQMGHQITTIGRTKLGARYESNASNTFFTLKDAFPQTGGIPLPLPLTNIGGPRFLQGDNAGSVVPLSTNIAGVTITFQLNEEPVIDPLNGDLGTPKPILVDLCIRQGAGASTSAILSACIHQSSLQEGSLNQIADGTYYIPALNLAPGPIPPSPLVAQGQTLVNNGYWPPSINQANDSTNAVYWTGEPIVVTLTVDVSNPIGTVTIAGGLTIGTSSSVTQDTAVSKFQTTYPNNHIHSIGPLPGISFTPGGESTLATATEGLAIRLLPGSTDVCGVIELYFQRINQGAQLPFTNFYKPSFFSGSLFSRAPDLIEVKFNTPYLQRVKNGVPSVMIQPDANLVEFGFRLAPMFRQSESTGATPVPASDQQFYSWAQPGQLNSVGVPLISGWNKGAGVFTNSTISNPMEGFTIVSTQRPSIDASAADDTFYGYIRYQVMTCVDTTPGTIANPPKPGQANQPGDPGFPFTNI